MGKIFGNPFHIIPFGTTKVPLKISAHFTHGNIRLRSNWDNEQP